MNLPINFPLNKLDIRMMIAAYLTKRKGVVKNSAKMYQVTIGLPAS